MIDARTLSFPTTIETDICIVGAGVAGISLAREFIKAKNRVCLVESGGATPDRETQSLYWGKNIGLPYYELDKSRARFLGGTSHFWHIPIGNNQLGVRLRALDPIDFEERDWVPYSGWPFDIIQLEPYYRKAHRSVKSEHIVLGRPIGCLRTFPSSPFYRYQFGHDDIPFRQPRDFFQGLPQSA